MWKSPLRAARPIPTAPGGCACPGGLSPASAAAVPVRASATSAGISTAIALTAADSNHRLNWSEDATLATGDSNVDGWRGPGQTLSLEASTSTPQVAGRTLLPVFKRPQRHTARPDPNQPPVADTVVGASTDAPAITAATLASNAANATAETATDAVAKAAAAVKAAAAAAMAAKWKARAAATAATAAAAQKKAAGLGSSASRAARRRRKKGGQVVLANAAAVMATAAAAMAATTAAERTAAASRSGRAPEAAVGAAPGPVEPPRLASAAPLQQQLKQLRLSGRLAEALDLSYMGISCYPLVRSFWASAASLELRIGRTAAAWGLLDEALRRWPGNAALLLAFGQVQTRRGEYDAAAAAFESALEREPGNGAVLHAWATAEAARGDLAKARCLFGEATRARPDMAHSYTSWARLEAAAGREAVARRLFRQGHAADPAHVPLLHAWAVFEANHNKQSAARRLLDRALELNPHHVPSWIALGTLEWRQGNPARAREVFKRALGAVGPRPPLLSALADMEIRLQNTDNARELFTRLRGVAPRHVPALLSEAKMEHRVGNRARAQQLYSEAAAAVAAGVVRGSEGGGPLWRAAEGSSDTLWQLRQQPQGLQVGGSGDAAAAAAAATDAISSAAVLHSWAQSQLSNGDLATADQLLLAVEAVEPNNGHMCHTRGLLCQREGALEEAKRWFRRGLDCRSSRDGALLCYEGLAEVLAFQGRKEKARAVWQAGIAALPMPTSRFLRQAALFEKKERNWTAAAALFADSVRRDPQDCRSWLQWGVYENGRRNWETAERCFQRGTSVAPRWPYLWLAYVSCLLAQQRIADARVVLRTATRHCPDCAQLWMEWALMEAAEGDAEVARRLFKKGAEVPSWKQHEPLYQAWAAFETKMGSQGVAARLRQQAEQVALARKARRQAALARRQAAEKAAAGGGSGGGAAVAAVAATGGGVTV